MYKKILAASLVSVLSFSSLPVFAASNVVQTSEKSATAYIYSGPNEVGEEHVVSIDGGDGEWRYGFKDYSLNLYSDLYHKNKIHKSCCEIDGNLDDSGWVSAGETSKSSLSGTSRESTGYCRYELG